MSDRLRRNGRIGRVVIIALLTRTREAAVRTPRQPPSSHSRGRLFQRAVSSQVNHTRSSPALHGHAPRSACETRCSPLRVDFPPACGVRRVSPPPPACGGAFFDECYHPKVYLTSVLQRCTAMRPAPRVRHVVPPCESIFPPLAAQTCPQQTECSVRHGLPRRVRGPHARTAAAHESSLPRGDSATEMRAVCVCRDRADSEFARVQVNQFGGAQPAAYTYPPLKFRF